MTVTDRYFIIVKESNVAAMNAWLDHHPQLDPRGGGGNTFARQVVWSNDPVDGSVVRGRVCEWKLPADWWETVSAEFNLRGLKINETRLNQWDGSYYPWSEGWNQATAMADETRKPMAMFFVEPVEV